MNHQAAALLLTTTHSLLLLVSMYIKKSWACQIFFWQNYYTTFILEFHYCNSSESDQSWGGGAFSLSHTTGARSRRRYTSGENSSSLRCNESLDSRSNCQEFVLQMLRPKVIEKLAQKLGLPPGILPCLELEVARLQLCLAVNRYKTVDCDVGCEQDESEAWDSSDSS